VNELVPTGTVTLVLADVEASTRLWESQPEEMAAAVAHLDRTVCEIVAACGGALRSRRDPMGPSDDHACVSLPSDPVASLN
jgi:class 3 adenylate cyclase